MVVGDIEQRHGAHCCNSQLKMTTTVKKMPQQNPIPQENQESTKVGGLPKTIGAAKAVDPLETARGRTLALPNGMH